MGIVVLESLLHAARHSLFPYYNGNPVYKAFEFRMTYLKTKLNQV